MENVSFHVPVYVVNTGVALSGHSADLAGGQVGLFDRATFSVATPAGNGKELFFAQGHIGGKDWYGFPITNTSHKSAFFYGTDVEDIYMSTPARRTNEEWVIGYNGSPSSKGLRYFKDAEPVKIKFLFTGGPTYRYFGGPKEYVVSLSPDIDCTVPCSGDCAENEVDPVYHTKKHIELINNHTELQKFGVHAAYVSSTWTVATTANMEKFRLTVCDNGDGVALNAVRAQYPLLSIERVARTTNAYNSSTVSVYEACVVSTAGDDTPLPFAGVGSVSLQNCGGTCPAGGTVVAAQEVWVIKRQIAAADALTTPAAKETFADTVGAAYTATAPNSSFLGIDGSVAVIEVKVAVGAITAPIGSDAIQLSYTTLPSCTFAAPTPIAWVAAGTGIRGQRQMRINQLEKADCQIPTSNRLADVNSILAGVKGIVLPATLVTNTPVNGCADDFTVLQWSNDCLTEAACMTTEISFHYDDLPPIDNSAWEEVIAPPAAAPFTVKTGIRITADYADIRFGNDSFDKSDYYETQPIKMEVAVWREWASSCDVSLFPSVMQTQWAQIERQSGEWVVREVICKTEAYQKHIDQFSNSPRMREAFDMNLLNMVDRKAFYNLYYVRFRASYGKLWRKNEQEKFTAVFAFKEDDPRQETFRTQVIGTLEGKSGVVMHINR